MSGYRRLVGRFLRRHILYVEFLPDALGIIAGLDAVHALQLGGGGPSSSRSRFARRHEHTKRAPGAINCGEY
jgi:hypothetical protein